MMKRGKIACMISCLVLMLSVDGCSSQSADNNAQVEKDTQVQEASENTDAENIGNAESGDDGETEADTQLASAQGGTVQSDTETEDTEQQDDTAAGLNNATLKTLDETVYTTDNVNVRMEPSTEAEVYKLLNMASELHRTGDDGTWSVVEINGEEYYVSSEYLTTEEPKTAQITTGQSAGTGITYPSSNGHVVCIDAGHQGKGDSTPEPVAPGASQTKARVTSGTSGRTTGVAEHQLTLQVAIKLRDELIARGYGVVMTRETSEVNISNSERAAIATNHGADSFIRIHANGSEDTSVNGAMTICQTSGNPYVGSFYSESKSLSQHVLDEFCAATGAKKQYVWETDTMSGINWSSIPVTILEMGYMTNPTEDTNMSTEAYQNKMVQGIANGIDAYYGL